MHSCVRQFGPDLAGAKAIASAKAAPAATAMVSAGIVTDGES